MKVCINTRRGGKLEGQTYKDQNGRSEEGGQA
jgi:hypothetical protein